MRGRYRSDRFGVMRRSSFSPIRESADYFLSNFVATPGF